MPNTATVPVLKSRSAELSVTRISLWSELQKISSQWETVAKNSEERHFFVSWDFISCWWQTYGNERELLVLRCHGDDGDVVGFAPLYCDVSKNRFGFETRTLRWIGDGSDDADGFGCLVMTGRESDCVRAIARWLMGNASEWDVLTLNCMPEESAATRELISQMANGRWITQSDFSPHLAIELPSSWEGYLQTLAPKVRQTWMRKVRKVEQQHTLLLRQTRSASELDADLATAFDLHNKSWRAKGRGGKLESEQRQEFYRSLSSASLKKDELDLWILEIDGVPRALRLGFLSGKKRYAMLAGLDPELSHLSLGTVVESLVLKQCIERGDQVYDFLAGDEAYKLECRPVKKRYVNMSVARPRTRAGIRLAADTSINAGKNWMRSALPATYSSLRSASRSARRRSPKASESGTHLHLESIRDRGTFDALERDWKALAAKNENSPIFLDWEWASSWLDAYGERELYVLAAFAPGGDCVGIAAFYVSHWPSGTAGSLRVLRLIGDETGDSGQLGFLTAKNFEREFTAAVVDWLDSNRGDWDALELQSLPRNAVTDAWLDEIDRRSWAVQERKSSHMVIDLPDSEGKFRASLSGGLRKSLAASKKQLASHEIRFHRCQSPGDVDSTLAQLFRLHSLRWKARGEPGAFADSRRREFYKSVAAFMLAAGRLDLWTMSMDGKIVAAEFGLLKGDRRMSIQSGFDPVFGHLHVGSLLDAQIIERSMERGVRSYDLMQGEQEYKKRWGARPRELVFMRCAPPRTMGAAWVKISGSKTAQKLWQRIKPKM